MTDLAIHQFVLVLMMGKWNRPAGAAGQFDISGTFVF
jgi:hypothetical protein